jgi:hypothetical protein
MLSANSGGSSLVTLQSVPILDIDVTDIDVTGQDAPAAVHAAQTCLPPQFQMPPLSNTVISAAPILTLAPTPASLDIPPVRSPAAPCAGFETEKEEPIAN